MSFQRSTERGLTRDLLEASGLKAVRNPLPNRDAFDGSDTARLIAEFEAKKKAEGAPVIKKLPTHSAATGQIRGQMASMRYKALVEDGKTLDELPYYLLNYGERRDRQQRFGNLDPRQPESK